MRGGPFNLRRGVWAAPNKSHVDAGGSAGYRVAMHPVDIQQIGEELAIRWADGTESFIPLAALRRACPCAGCQGERDVLGQLHKGPDRPLTPASFRLLRIVPVGGYALQPIWADGHDSGLYTFDYFRRIADQPVQPQA